MCKLAVDMEVYKCAVFLSSGLSCTPKKRVQSLHLTLAGVREKKSGNASFLRDPIDVGLKLSAPRDLERQRLWEEAEADGT